MVSCSNSMTKKLKIWLFAFLNFFGSGLSLANIEDSFWIYHHKGEKVKFEVLGLKRGLPQIELYEIVKKFHLKAQFNPSNFELKITNPRTRLTAQLKTFSDRVNFGSFEVRLSRPPYFEGARLYVPIEFGDRVLTPLLSGEPPNLPESLDGLYANQQISPAEPVDIFLDPGHGGNDYGAHVGVNGQTLKEKDFTLQIAQELGEYLVGHGLRVGFSRTEDTFLTLFERSRLASQKQAKFFLSLHLNSSTQKKHRGFEAYVLSVRQNDAEGRAAVAEENQTIPEDLPPGLERALADIRADAQLELSLGWAKGIIAAFQNHGIVSSGKPLKMGPFYVLYASQMPSVLLELGYLTHPEDRAFLLPSPRRTQLLKSLAENLARTLKPGITAR